QQYDLLLHAERRRADLYALRREGLAVARHLPQPQQSGISGKAGSGTPPAISRSKAKKSGTPEGAVPARDSAAGGTNLRPKPMRRLSFDRGFPEHSAGAGWYARQADAPLPLARHQNAGHLPGRPQG